jgi:hypothetical protein
MVAVQQEDVNSSELAHETSHINYLCESRCALNWGFRAVLGCSFISFIFMLLALLAAYEVEDESKRRKLIGVQNAPIKEYGIALNSQQI